MTRQFQVKYTNCIIYIGEHRYSPSPLATKCYNAILAEIGQPRNVEGTIIVGADGRFGFVEAAC